MTKHLIKFHIDSNFNNIYFQVDIIVWNILQLIRNIGVFDVLSFN